MARRRFPVVVEHNPETGIYTGMVPFLPYWVMAQGESVDDAVEEVRKVLNLYLEDPDEDPEYLGNTGKVVLREIEADVPEPVKKEG